MAEDRKMIYLCLAHMSEDGMEQKYVKEAFDTNWVVPLGPNVNGFEKDLEEFVSLPPAPSSRGESLPPTPSSRGGEYRETADPALYNLLKDYAEDMRKNPTEAENVAWNLLRGCATGHKFRRQHIIGDYIVDFVCLEKYLVVEIDGEYHNEWEQQVDDAQRSAWLESRGFRVVRFSNAEVLASSDSFVSKVTEALQVLPTGEDLGGASTGEDLGGVHRVVALSAGTAAVHLALIGCGVKDGDEVIVQSFTFCASSHPITYLGAKPVFVDSEPLTWNMDPELLEKAIIDRKEKTGKYPKAIVPVALYGMPYDCDKIMTIADKYGIPVVEDAAEGFGSRYKGKVLGTFGKYGVFSFNGNKMITTSGGGALVCRSAEDADRIMWYATQARDAYPYYHHTDIGYNYRLSNVCAGIGRGQMTIVNDHIAHHKHVQELYRELLKDVKGITLHEAPEGSIEADASVQLTQKRWFNMADASSIEAEASVQGSMEACASVQGSMEANASVQSSIEAEASVQGSMEGKRIPIYDSNYWLCTITIDPEVKVKGQENAYKEVVKSAVGGAAGVIHQVDSATTDCQPNDNVEAMRMWMLEKKVECRPVWKPMHRQPVYADGAESESQRRTYSDGKDFVCLEGPKMVAYVNGVSEEIFKMGMCLPAGPCVSDDDVRYIVECLKEGIMG